MRSLQFIILIPFPKAKVNFSFFAMSQRKVLI